jgi:hypothetical protein
MINEIKLNNNNIKITMGLLCRELKFPIDKHVEKLPKTQQILKENMIIK